MKSSMTTGAAVYDSNLSSYYDLRYEFRYPKTIRLEIILKYVSLRIVRYFF